jgi:hypothetical protein
VPLDIGLEVAALRRLTAGQLRRRFAEVIGEATAVNNKPWLVKRIAWQLHRDPVGSVAAGDALQRLAALPRGSTDARCRLRALCIGAFVIGIYLL